MTEINRLSDIKKRLESGAYGPPAAEDIRQLVTYIEEQMTRMATLQKKNDVLAAHVMELTQEMENVKSDFGNNR
jgi:hypothetical protein